MSWATAWVSSMPVTTPANSPGGGSLHFPRSSTPLWTSAVSSTGHNPTTFKTSTPSTTKPGLEYVVMAIATLSHTPRRGFRRLVLAAGAAALTLAAGVIGHAYLDL